MNKKKVKMIIISVCVVVVLTYISMYNDTISLKNEVIAVCKGEKSPAQTDDSMMQRYYYKQKYPEMAYATVDIDTKVVWHNFKEGYMWVVTSIGVFDESDKVCYYAEDWVRWKIKKIDGKWDIISIKWNPYKTSHLELFKSLD